MEGLKETIDDRKVRFVVIAIEEGAKRLGVSPEEFCARINAQGLIENLLMKHYDMLHSQSQAYVAEYIVDALLCREKE